MFINRPEHVTYRLVLSLFDLRSKTNGIKMLKPRETLRSGIIIELIGPFEFGRMFVSPFGPMT